MTCTHWATTPRRPIRTPEPPTSRPLKWPSVRRERSQRCSRRSSPAARNGPSASGCWGRWTPQSADGGGGSAGTQTGGVPRLVPVEDGLYAQTADPGRPPPGGLGLDGRAVLRAGCVGTRLSPERGGPDMQRHLEERQLTARLPVWRRLGWRLGGSFLLLTAIEDSPERFLRVPCPGPVAAPVAGLPAAQHRAHWRAARGCRAPCRSRGHADPGLRGIPSPPCRPRGNPG